MAIIKCGANTASGPEVVGKTVGELRRILSDELDIPEGAVAYLNGDEVPDSSIVMTGMRLEYARPAGQKG